MGKIKRRHHSKEKLRKASNLLFYEIEMLKRLVLGIASGIAGDSVIKYALLESFVIHARVLIDFFYSESTYDDDIVVEDFFSCPDEWLSIRPPKKEILTKAKKRADKELAHLTYTRIPISPEQKKWDIFPIFTEINSAMDVFLKNVPDELLGDRWDTFLQQKRLAQEREVPNKKYGTRKLMYKISLRKDGIIEITVHHSNKTFLQFLQKHAKNPKSILSHQESFGKSNIRAKYWFSKIISDYHQHFESGLVNLVFNKDQ